MAAQSLSPVEKALIRGQWDAQISEPYTPATALAKSVVECRFKDALISETARAVIKPTPGGVERLLEELFDLSSAQDDNSFESELARLAVAVACLHAFVQANWTGPDLDIEPLDLLAGSAAGEWTADLLQARAVAELAYGGEPAYHLARAIAFLRLAQLLVARPFAHLASAAWWLLRIATVHQRVLDEPVAGEDDFRAPLAPLVAGLAGEPELGGRLQLEIGLLEHTLGQDRLAGEDFVKAARATGLKYELSGALGKRTKFQQKDLSQLVLLAESHLEDTDTPVGQDTQSDATPPVQPNVPETLALNDDTLLEQTEFTSSSGGAGALSHIDPAAQPPLHPLDQCILLSLCLNVRNTQPAHGLTAEQMSPYISRVISHPRNWSVHTMALLLRARLEATRTRTVERSALQLQALIDQMPTTDAPPAERLRLFHAIPLPSLWEMDKELAQRLLSIGVVKSALDIFTRREMWADAVQCHAALETPEKGIAIVRDLLEGRKAEADAVANRAKGSRPAQDAAREAKLWCLLGDLDAPHAVEHYRRAWEVSGGTSARAMRALGGLHFSRGEWADAVECLRRAVRISPLVLRAWFILGCACMRCEDWVGARDAFARCVAIDEEDGESWNNLASMYLRIGTPKSASTDEDDDKERDPSEILVGSSTSIPFEHKLLAFRALKQGLRFAYENWRMWANYSIVAMDVGELAEAARALGRVVAQTEGKLGVDEDVLERLVNAVTRADFDAPPAAADPADPASGEAQSPNEGHLLYPRVLDLLERELLPRLATPRVFRAYARLLSWARRWDAELKAHLDAYRAGTAAAMAKGDAPDARAWAEAVGEVRDVVDVLRNFGPRVEGSRWRAQARSLVRSFMGKMRDMEGEEGWAELEEIAEELKKEEDE